MKGICQVKTVAYAVALPGPANTPINWQNVELSNQLEMVDIQSGAIDPRIINLIGAISQQHTITISALRSDHSRDTASGNVSNHYYGRAMDIAAIDGVACTDTAPTAPCARAGDDALSTSRSGACRPSSSTVSTSMVRVRRSQGRIIAITCTRATTVNPGGV